MRRVDAAIHAPDSKGDQRNRHGHLLVTMRAVTPEGFGAKVREWNSTEQALRWRQQWAELGARYLQKAGHALEAERYKVGHLTLERQRQAAVERGDLAHAEALDRVPTRHLGPQRSAMERRGVETDIGNAYRDDLTYAKDEAADRAALAELDRQIAERRAHLARQTQAQEIAQAYARARAEATDGGRHQIEAPPPDVFAQARAEVTQQMHVAEHVLPELAKFHGPSLFGQISATLHEVYDRIIERARELSAMFARNMETALATPKPPPLSKKDIVLSFKPPDPDRSR